jgi:Tetratricopeptide repeat
VRSRASDDPEFRSRTITAAATETDRISALVRNLLLLARADAGANIQRQPVRLADVLAVVGDRAGRMADVVTLHTPTAGEPDGIVIDGDADYLEQMVLILLHDAVKYTQLPGGVWLDAHATGTEVLITVRDTGLVSRPRTCRMCSAGSTGAVTPTPPAAPASAWPSPAGSPANMAGAWRPPAHQAKARQSPSTCRSLTRLGELATWTSATSQARARHARALAIARDLGAAPEEARALEGLSQAHLQDGNPGQAAAHLRQALVIYQRIGAPPRGASSKPSTTTHWHPPPHSPSQRLPPAKTIRQAAARRRPAGSATDHP